MADESSTRGAADPARVTAGQGYEVHYFAQKHGLSVRQAREMIRNAVGRREKLKQAASRQFTGG
jgi:hypothetical protein